MGLSNQTSLEPVIVVDHLSKSYGKVEAIHDVSFMVPKGSITGFVGPNGAGKSTTLRCLLGLAKPSSGNAKIFGTEYVNIHNPALRIGTVLDASKMHPGRRARNVLCHAAKILGISVNRVDEVIELCGLTDKEAKRIIKTYSLGMRQRLALALAILPNPDLLILDEPVNGLDPDGIHWMRQFLKDFTNNGGTVLLSSHLLGEMEKIADRVVMIGKGRLIDTVQVLDLAGLGMSLEDLYLEKTKSTSRKQKGALNV